MKVRSLKVPLTPAIGLESARMGDWVPNFFLPYFSILLLLLTVVAQARLLTLEVRVGGNASSDGTGGGGSSHAGASRGSGAASGRHGTSWIHEISIDWLRCQCIILLL